MRELRIFRILIILAGVMGADGVILAAVATHQNDAARLAPASSMLLFHAGAVLATAALTERGVIHRAQKQHGERRSRYEAQSGEDIG